MRSGAFPAILVAASLLVGPAARAEAPVDDSTRNSARILADEAKDLFERGQYAGALDRYTRAEQLVPVATLGVRVARCLDKLGRLNEAAEKYLAVLRVELPRSALEVHREAQAQAEAERTALMPRIPSVVLQVDAPATAAITIDGKLISPALYGARRATDPGKHVLEARNGAALVTREFTLREGEVLPLVVALGSAPRPLDPVAPLASTGPAAAEPSGSAPARRVAGIVGIGVGGAGLVLGVIAGALAFGKKGELKEKCGGFTCSSSLAASDGSIEPLVDGYNRSRAISSAGIIGGAIVAAAGVVLVVTAPAPRKAGASLGVFVGAEGLGLRGVF